jgi:hypothetical protein
LKSFRFAHIADAHVGAWPKNQELRQALRDSVLKALEAVEKEKCDFLVIAGDLFHTPVPHPEEVVPLAGALRRLNEKGIRIYAIFGSHDYVLNQASWLDVLSEGGLFVRIAPSSAMEEGMQWDLPFVKDQATGAVLAGVSGRAQGLDKKHYETMDSTLFSREEGFKIFLFHAGILEFLPSGLAGRVEGLPVAGLPRGCGYYAGGHIHETYSGSGPDGKGILVNPGAVFGTSNTDLENISSGKTQAGIVIVEVEDNMARPRWVITTPKDSIKVVDVNLDGCSAEEALKRVKSTLPAGIPSGSLVVPRLHGAPARQLDLTLLSTELKKLGAGTVHLDTQDLSSEEESPEEKEIRPTEEIELDVFREAFGQVKGPEWAAVPQLQGESGLKVANEILRSLGIPKVEGESREDYRRRMVREGLKVLGLPPEDLAKV